jgi:hypothetical protein
VSLKWENVTEGHDDNATGSSDGVSSLSNNTEDKNLDDNFDEQSELRRKVINTLLVRFFINRVILIILTCWLLFLYRFWNILTSKEPI